jgi:hypothetical protein
MHIDGLIWLDEVVDKLQWKHNIETHEVEEVFKNKPYIVFKEKGRLYVGEDVYLALGKTEAGRYLFVLFIYKKDRKALVLTARSMTKSEKRFYEKKKK